MEDNKNNSTDSIKKDVESQNTQPLVQPSHHTSSTSSIKDPVFNFRNMDKMKLLTIIVSALLVITLINSYGIFFSGKGETVTGNVANNPTPVAPTPTPAAAPTPSPTEKVELSLGDAPIKGNEDALVTIVEFSDYECPFCSRFYSQTLPQIEEQYIKTGKVKLVYKDFPLSFHPNAQKSAEAAKCFGEQKGDEGYYQYHDKIFENQGSLSLTSLKSWARELGADGAQFDSCLDSGKMASKVQAEFREGQSAGVRGTPAFFINGKLISGAQPFSAFQQAIEAEL